MIHEGEEEPIEEEIEGFDATSPAVKQGPDSKKSSQKATTKDSSSEVEGRKPVKPFTEEPIEFSESFKKKETLNNKIH